MNTKHPLLAIVTASATLVFAGCGSSGAAKPVATEQTTKPGAASTTAGASAVTTATASAKSGCKGAQVAYISPGLSIPFWRSMSAGVKRGGAAKGATIKDFDSNLNNSTQLQNAQDAITGGAAAIVISPTDSASAPAVLEVAAKAGVPVVIADIGTDGGTFAAFIKTDNVAGAAAAGKYLVKQLTAKGITSGELGIIGIAQSRKNGVDRTRGFTEVVEAAGFKVVSLLESKDYTRSEGLKLAQDLLTAHSKMVGIFSEHDEASQGAITAIRDAGAAKSVVLVGFDGSPDTFTSISSGEMGGAAMQQPVLMGQKAFDAACAVLDGGTPEQTIFVDTVMVTQDNVKEVKPQVEDSVFAEK
jgi:ribose transport system substrate-binding protein